MTKFNAFQIKFDKNHLDALVQENKSGVRKRNCQYHLALHPAQFGKFSQSVKDELGKRTAKYDKNIKGVLLGFENVLLDSDLGVIGLDNCHIHIDVRADFYIFLPKIDMVLKGIVTKTSKDHVGCLLYKTFNVSLPKSECPDEEWVGDEVKIGNEVQFKITYIDLESRMVYIRAQLLTISNTNQIPELVNVLNKNILNKKIKFEEEENEELPSNKKSKKKSKVITNSQPEQEITETEPVKPKKKKKAKKEKRKEQDEEEINRKREKRKEKKKREKEDDVSLEELDIKSLFEEVSIDVSKSAETMANKDDTKTRKRSKSFSAEDFDVQRVKIEFS